MLASQVPGEPIARVPCSTTPAGQDVLTRTHTLLLSSGITKPSTAAIIRVSELNHTAHKARCLRFAAGVTPGPRKTRYRPAGYALVGRNSHPLGSNSKFQGGISSSFPNGPSFAWRTAFRAVTIF